MNIFLSKKINSLYKKYSLWTLMSFLVGAISINSVCFAEILLLGSGSMKDFKVGDGITAEGEKRSSIFPVVTPNKNAINAGQTRYEFKFVESLAEANEYLSASLSGKSRFGIASSITLKTITMQSKRLSNHVSAKF